MFKKNNISLWVLCFFALSGFWQEVSAQDYLKAKTRFRFAQTYLGLDSIYSPESGRIYSPIDTPRSISHSFSPRLTIGGLHFWGHADFYVSFPIYSNLFTEAALNSSLFIYSGIETGFHFYPWQLEYDTLRPFLGISWVVSSFRQTFEDESQGSHLSLHRFPVILGLSYQNEWGQIDITARYIVNPNFEYYINPSEKREYQLLPLSLSLGYKYIFDTTISNEKKSQLVKKKTEMLKKAGRLSGMSLGIGPSAAITLRTFETSGQERAFLNINPRIALLPEATLGYHIYEIDSEVRIAYRFMNQQQGGFEVEQTFRRHAVSLEFIKFLFDYNGFVPFLGIGAEYNHLLYREKSNAPMESSASKFGLPIVFGWDIRPVVSTKWLLRTNLRYNPLTYLESQGNRVPFEHFEFNFIQFVYYFNR